MTHSILFNQKDVTIKQNPEQCGKVKISLLITSKMKAIKRDY